MYCIPPVLSMDARKLHRSRSSGKALSSGAALIHDFLSLFQSLICYFRPGCLAADQQDRQRSWKRERRALAGTTYLARRSAWPVKLRGYPLTALPDISFCAPEPPFFRGFKARTRFQHQLSISIAFPAAGKESAMASRDTQPLRRTIRRHQLREMVPLADSTVYEMEQRGEFPRRFALSPRCVVWDLAEIEAWLDARRNKPVARAPHPDVARRRTRPVKAGVRK